MGATLIDGKSIAEAIRNELRQEVDIFSNTYGRRPGLATVLVGDDPASHTYVANKIKGCAAVGMDSIHLPLPATTLITDLVNTIRGLNTNPRVDAILLQLPLPAGLDSTPALEAIDPEKDADGLHPFNLGNLFESKNWTEMAAGAHPLSCTPHGVIQLLQRMKIAVAGKHVVVVGRSKLVGKPVSMMLQALDATVTMAHSRTTSLDAVCRQADILVSAIGRARFITSSMVKPGAVVIDVGINRDAAGRMCGDVDTPAVSEVASAITPVPGGVGPMTIAMLLYNTLQLAKKREMRV